MSSASSKPQFPIDHVLGVLKASISHRPCPQRPQIPHRPSSNSSSNSSIPFDHVLGVLKSSISHRQCLRRPRILNFPSTMSSASSNPQFPIDTVFGVLKSSISHRHCLRRPRILNFPSTISSAWIRQSPASPRRSYSPSSSLQRVLKSSISHQPCPRRPQRPQFPIDHVLGVDSPCSSESSAFLFPILQPPARPQILNFPSIMSSAPSFLIHHVICVDSPCSSMSLRLRILHAPARPPGLAFSILRSSSHSPRTFPWWRSVPVRHTKSARTPAGFPRYNFRTSTGNLFFVVETDPRPHLITQDSRGSPGWNTG
jgi:hypothetical protein